MKEETKIKLMDLRYELDKVRFGLKTKGPTKELMTQEMYLIKEINKLKRALKKGERIHGK